MCALQSLMNTFLHVQIHGGIFLLSTHWRCCRRSQTGRHKGNGWVTVSPEVCLSCHRRGMLEELQWLWRPVAVWQPHFPDSSGQRDKEADRGACQLDPTERRHGLQIQTNLKSLKTLCFIRMVKIIWIPQHCIWMKVTIIQLDNWFYTYCMFFWNLTATKVSLSLSHTMYIMWVTTLWPVKTTIMSYMKRHSSCVWPRCCHSIIWERGHLCTTQV